MTLAATTPSPAPHHQPLTLIGLLVGVTLAPLLAFNQTPSATLYNQLLAFAGFGLLAVGLAWGASLRRGWRLDGVTLGLLIMLAAALTAPSLNGLPWSMALTSAAMLLGAAFVIQIGRSVRADQREDVLTLFCLALVGAGLLSVIVCFVQFFVPTWADGNVIARTGLAGRAVGNMRQPNHLASLLMWACVAAVWLAQGGWLTRQLGSALRGSVALGVLLFLFVLCVLFSASRTGTIGVILLAVWGVVDGPLRVSSSRVVNTTLGRLRLGVRIALMLTPLMWGLCWLLVAWWTHASGHAFGAEARLNEGAGSPTRLAILSNAWSLLQRYPWTGSGWGDFNLAWTMTPFPERPVAFFDHTHNLLMQVLVELGFVVGGVVLLALLIGVATAAIRAWRAPGAAGHCAFMVVAMIGLHSMFEYPLWYAYFLLPAAFALGLCLPRSTSEDDPAPSITPIRRWVPLVLGAVMTALVPLTVLDYLRIVHIYAPPADAASLDERIVVGQGSPLFDLQADYAAATVLPPGADALGAAQRTGHHLIDVRLMMAWAKSLNAVGETDKARYLVQRLKEFRNAAAEDWLGECAALSDVGDKLRPFQCDAPTREYDFREMRDAGPKP
ncbi:PglL family O-oligosaccharyltransferase [Roseateles amylovorans]|uniref:Wzy polymerase domain-containing protein n=1 Tax=Roseateles amylovorans TaxID=2978473 RepID=A0ABY6B3S9_9BURK|nr:Wzy polymerase domain-containing protein [Roseateles amylovorans]UXH78183.1 Wzy polymerase domain-containing protein [Roseateles amylovorans]